MMRCPISGFCALGLPNSWLYRASSLRSFFTLRPWPNTFGIAPKRDCRPQRALQCLLAPNLIPWQSTLPQKGEGMNLQTDSGNGKTKDILSFKQSGPCTDLDDCEGILEAARGRGGHSRGEGTPRCRSGSLCSPPTPPPQRASGSPQGCVGEV